MKNSIITIVFSIMSITVFAQKTYLKIYKNSALTDLIMYPPGTEFELKNEQGYILMKNSEAQRVFEIDGKYKLWVFPSFKKQPEVIYLTEGKIELALTSEFSDASSESIKTKSGKVSAKKELIDSKKYKGKRNVIFRLSNGLVFKYMDGKYNATLGNKPLEIEGKYIIKSKLGVLKLSFNPGTGKLWWYFEE